MTKQKVYEEPIDYNHIRIHGQMQNWSENYIKSQQINAFDHNAPYDTIEMINNKALRFQDMPQDYRRRFVDFQLKNVQFRKPNL